jgi:hypothetical protein
MKISNLSLSQTFHRKTKSMEDRITLLYILLPAVVVGLVTYLIIRSFLQNQLEKHKAELRQELVKSVLPTRLQAYEKSVLFLDRISPSNLIMRVYKNGMSAKLLHAELLEYIREAYEDNMAQQTYVSDPAWMVLRSAKEETVRIINIAAASLPHDATGPELSAAIYTEGEGFEKLPTDTAIEYVKEELDKMIRDCV